MTTATTATATRREQRRRGSLRRGCARCRDRAPIDYKDVVFLERFVAPSGKIMPARTTGCARSCQRRIALAIKRARHLALLPYAPQHRPGQRSSTR